MTMIRILVVPPGEAPRVESVDNASWRTWYPLVSPTTHIFERLAVAPQIDLLCDEEGQMREMPLNVLIPGRAPVIDLKHFVVDRTHGEGMQPNEPGIGYYRILGTFLLVRRRGATSVDLRVKDIELLRKKLAR